MRRSDSDQFKAQVLAECAEPGASVAQVAMSTGSTTTSYTGGGCFARVGRRRVRSLAARLAAVMRIDAVWLALELLDLRIGMDTALARVVAMFGAAQPHHAYLFTYFGTDRLAISREQLNALVLGLPWRSLADSGVITVL